MSTNKLHKVVFTASVLFLWLMFVMYVFLEKE